MAFCSSRAEVPDSLVETFPASDLPPDWDQPECRELKALGDQWLREARSVGLMVPSVLMPSEMNVLLNPSHPEYGVVKFSEPEPFLFDPRIVK